MSTRQNKNKKDLKRTRNKEKVNHSRAGTGGGKKNLFVMSEETGFIDDNNQIKMVLENYSAERCVCVCGGRGGYTPNTRSGLVLPT